MNKLIFFCIASAILLFSIITINIVPIIGGLVGSSWGSPTESCKYLSDKYDIDKDKTYNSEEVKESTLDNDKKKLNRCNRKQAMVGLEYTSLNVNLFVGFICAFFGLLLFLNLGNLGKIPGLIGLIGGVVGFVLTLVYVIESGLVFNDIDESNPSGIRIDSDGAYLEWDAQKNSYFCIFYDDNNRESIYLKYSDYANEYLNYKKDYIMSNKDAKYKDTSNNGCNEVISITWTQCKNINKNINLVSQGINKRNDCNKIYLIDNSITDNDKKIIFDRWLTSIILSCFIALFNIGLAIFGFLLFRETSGSSG